MGSGTYPRNTHTHTPPPPTPHMSARVYSVYIYKCIMVYMFGIKIPNKSPTLNYCHTTSPSLDCQSSCRYSHLEPILRMIHIVQPFNNTWEFWSQRSRNFTLVIVVVIISKVDREVRVWNNAERSCVWHINFHETFDFVTGSDR